MLPVVAQTPRPLRYRSLVTPAAGEAVAAPAAVQVAHEGPAERAKPRVLGALAEPAGSGDALGVQQRLDGPERQAGGRQFEDAPDDGGLLGYGEGFTPHVAVGEELDALRNFLALFGNVDLCPHEAGRDLAALLGAHGNLDRGHETARHKATVRGVDLQARFVHEAQVAMADLFVSAYPVQVEDCYCPELVAIG